MIIFILIGYIQSVDICVQQTTYEECINLKGEQCKWNGQLCKWSNNYLFGCDPSLNEKLCTKQIGKLDGTIANCIFDKICHTIYEQYFVKCTDKLSKSGCLSVTNPDQLCKWEDDQCTNLNQTEFNNINNIFQNLELSASVCSRITGFLIIHYSILWNLIDYYPDIVSEAQKKLQIEAGMEFQESKIYQDQNLKDNYIDSNGTFIWYTQSTKQSISDTKYNDYQRYGCIAQEILNENTFIKLFSLNGTIRGVNHVYCKYLNVHPRNSIFTVFVQYECQEITQYQLSDQLYVNQNKLQCQDMSGIVCQRFKSSEVKCMIDYTKEFQCRNIDIIQIIDDCKTLSGYDTHYSCATVIQEYCYLDISIAKGQCSRQCSILTSKFDCENNLQCRWLGQNLGNIIDSKQSIFRVCVPLNGCNQIGINKKYCQEMSMNCYWNSNIQSCQEIEFIEQLRCIDCNSIYCCSSVTIYDQFCIWNLDKCLNVKDQNLFSHYQSFSTSIVMNQNLCLSQRGQYNYYDIITRTCKTENIDLYSPCVDFKDQDYQLDNKPCDNGINARINQELCLALINSNTKWDAFLQKCIHVTNKSIQCDLMKFVNPNLCKYGIVQESSSICLYNLDSLSCYSTQLTDLHCDTPGINFEQCVSNQSENCQWQDNQCIYLKANLIVQYYCHEFQKVSPNVCRFTTQHFSCEYDFKTFGCSIITNQINNSHQYFNNQGCFTSNGQYYFDNVQNKCKEATDYLNIIKCETEFLSKQTCLSITTNNQFCFWGSIPSDHQIKCRQYKQQFQTSCYSYQNSGNLNICTQMTSNFSLTLTDDQFCEVIDSKCVSSISTIDDLDCGYNRKINIHRCVAFTTYNCYFDNNRCTLISGPYEYQQMLLRILECHQSNLQICNKILTPNQICQISEDKKCVQMYLSFSDTCQNLSQYDMNQYNPNICSKAIDACYYDFNNKACKQPVSSDKFKCSQIGASKKLCLEYTHQNCIFINDNCQTLVDLSIDCKFRNKYACFQGVISCYWNEQSSACGYYFSDCPIKYDNNINWQICQGSYQNCFAGQNGCIKSFSNILPCWLSISQQLCNSQSNYCQWLDNRCISDYYECEQAQSKQECLLHRSNFCVFHQNKCFTIINTGIYDCDYFDQVSENFCRQYQPICTFSVTNFKCIKVHFMTNSHMIDEPFQSTTCNYLSQNIYSCILQRSLKCSYFNYSWYQFCGNSNILETCNYFSDTIYPSILTCESLTNCKFGMTLQGEPFCSTTPLQCENLQSFCLKDIQGLHCYQDLDSNQCLTYNEQLLCENVQFYRVSKQLCISIMQNPNNLSECYYQEQTQQCKIKNPLTLSNGNDKIYDYYFCLFKEKSYLLYYKSMKFEYCSSYSQGNTENLNLYGCTQLQDKTYYFDLTYFKCYNEIKQPYILVFLCLQMNQQACLQIQNHLSCVWINKQCHKYRNEFINIPCENRNYNSCIQSKTQKCIWNKNTLQCIEKDIECQKNQCEYSEQYCQSHNKLWNGNDCYEYKTDLPISFFRCDQLGLSKVLCLSQTSNLTCYWNGYICQEANLYILNCQDEVSQSTCIQIKTPKQICKWINEKCENQYHSNQCEDFFTLQYCRQSLLSCQYNLSLQKCESKIENSQICSDTLSYKACQNVQYEFCQFDGYCNIWYNIKQSCENIVNFWGCMNTSMYCKWIGECVNIEETFEPVVCNKIPIEFNKVSCKKYSIEPCLYDEIHKKCDIKLTSAIIDSTNIDQTNYTQIRLIYECNQFIEKEDCIGSRIGYCEWQNNKCLNCESNENCQNDNCNNKSIKQCLIMHNLFCAWRNDQCIDWMFDQQNFTQSLITKKCCKSMNSTVKYVESISSCIQIDIIRDECNTFGLSKIACLSLISKQCTYKDDQCINYIFSYKSKCNQYYDINQQVCQQLPHLSCKYDVLHNKCIDVDYSKDSCLTIGLSKQGCSNITQMACYWSIQTQQCLNFELKMHINQCDDETVTNSYTCQLLNYHLDVCSYNINKRTCQQKSNPFTNCSQPGLNRLACLKLVNQPCQYINNQCQKVKSLISSCNDLRDVNELTCKMNSNDHCIYDQVNGNCQYTLQQLPCNQAGLNINNCNSQRRCQWIHDIQQCICKSLQIISQCNLNEKECINNCIFEEEFNICRPKKCFDLINCSGIMNTEYCYEDQYKKCQGAKKCEDIINLNESKQCSDFMFNGSNCIQISNYCVSQNNLQEICINSNCSNTSCKYDNFICRPLICQDYIEEEQCQQISNCVYMNGICKQIQTCSEIYDQSICLKTKVNEKQCSWEIYEIYQATYHCTNNYCNLYNDSPNLCNGNEINQYSCYMNDFLICQKCEDIRDPCLCLNGCIYLDGRCQSKLCQNYDQEQQCLNSNKCYWSTKDQLCRKFCRYIIFLEDCQSLNYECHWNPYQYKCEDGVYVETNLSVTLDQYEKYAQTIFQFILILVLFQ